jgi:polyisoprenoid-binding protein YceI
VNNSNAQSFKVKTFKMTVNGISTMHEWESQVEELECKASYEIEENVLVDIKEAIIRIPVRSIKSPKGKMMDNKTYDAFNSEKYPTIIFSLVAEKISPSALTAELKGILSMAGTTKPIDLLIAYKVLPGGDLRISGTKKIIMTEFKMEPPTAMMGAIEVGDEVVVHFEIVLSSATNNL